MKRGRSLMMALAVLALVPMPLLAQGGGQGQNGRGNMGGMMAARGLVEQGSVEFLVSKAAELSLTDAQKTQLQTIAAKWVETVKEPREQVKTNMPQRGQGGDREAMQARMETLRPHVQKLVEEDTKALDEAMKLLDDTQKAAAKTLLEERAASTRPRRGGGGGR